MARKKPAEGEKLYSVRSPFGAELVSAPDAKQAAERYIDKREPAASTILCVREGSGREERFHYRQPRAKKK